MARDRLGRDVFARGAPEALTVRGAPRWQASLADLLGAYARIRTREEYRPLQVDRRAILSLEAALERLRGLMGAGIGLGRSRGLSCPRWVPISAARGGSALASCFAATLELARAGEIEIAQDADLRADPAARTGGRAMPEDTGFGDLFGAPPPQVERMVEAVLFASAEPLAEADIAARLPAGADVAAALAALQGALCRARGAAAAGRAGLGVPHRARSRLPALREAEETRKLSRAAIETLAIIAYHQPVTRAEIEEIRGVSSLEGQLRHADGARLGPARAPPRDAGPPRHLRHHARFLDHFGLESAADLPGLAELRAAGMLSPEPPGTRGDD